jgi:hypothetical protein
MDSIKEIYDAFSQKIKSPFFGHIIIAFVLWNWKSIYYVIYSGKPALTKFNYFDANMVGWSYVIPVVVGIITALASPYVSNWGSLWATKPVNARRLRETQEAHKILVEDNRLLAERENSQRIHRKELAGDEQELIDKAKRDVEIDQFPDDVKEGLQSQIDELRVKPFNISDFPQLSNEDEPKLNDFARDILLRLGQNEDAEISLRQYITGTTYNFDGRVISETNDRIEFQKMKSALQQLRGERFIDVRSSGRNKDYTLAPDGIKIYNKLTNASKR